MLEQYDFVIYGTASALIFGRLFFPNISPTAGTMASFGAYAVGFAARPLGGLFFSRYGDRLGRKWVLVATLLWDVGNPGSGIEVRLTSRPEVPEGATRP